MPEVHEQVETEFNPNHEFHGGYGQHRVSFYVSAKPNCVKNIRIEHHFGGNTLLSGEYSLSELESPQMNRADLVRAIRNTLKGEQNKPSNCGSRMKLPWSPDGVAAAAVEPKAKRNAI